MKNSVARVQPVKTFRHIPNKDNFPLSLGANFHDDPLNRNTLRKSHNLLLSRQENNAPHTEYCYNDVRKLCDCDSTEVEDGQKTCDALDSGNLLSANLNSFVAHMLAYSIENTPESSTQENRIRKVCIKFFTEDNSISIIELSEPNNDTVQKTFLSRRQVPKRANDSSELVLLNDFKIGKEVLIYAITYHIVDMDKRTRRFFREILGEDVPPPEDLPQPGVVYFVQSSKNNPVRVFTSDDMDRKRVIEQKLTGIYSKRSNEDILITQQFLKNDINDHLSYLALWDDRGNISGDLHFCVIRLFLENFALEVIEHNGKNGSCSAGKVLISRQRIPKPGFDVTKAKSQEHTFGKLLKNGYLEPQDLLIGDTYMIFGKPFFLYACNEKTRTYMKSNFNVSLRSNIDISPFITEENSPILFYPPPPNGFGSERDQRENWLKLNPKNPKVDLESMEREAGRVLTFAARLANPLVKGDEERKFVMTFYCDTKELSINEKVERNSGFEGGRFLSKGGHRKELPNGTFTPFDASDFFIGASVTVYKRTFLLYDITPRTKLVLEGKDKVTTEAKVKDLILLFKQQLKLKFTKAREAYLALAPQGILGYSQIKDFLRTCSCNISDEEAILIAKNLFPDGMDVLRFDTFLKMLGEISESMSDAFLGVHSTSSVDMFVDDTIKHNTLKSEINHRRSQLKQFLREKLMQSKQTLQQQFRIFSEYSLNSRLSRDAFRRSLRNIMDFRMDKADEDILVSMVFDGIEDSNNQITYRQFQNFVELNGSS